MRSFHSESGSWLAYYSTPVSYESISQCGVTDLLVPARDRELQSQDSRAHLITVLTYLPEVAALGFTQR